MVLADGGEGRLLEFVGLSERLRRSREIGRTELASLLAFEELSHLFFLSSFLIDIRLLLGFDYLLSSLEQRALFLQMLLSLRG